MLDDYGNWDPPIWFGILALYILPIFLCFFSCKKYKRKPIPSILISISYTTICWAFILSWFFAMAMSVLLLKELGFIPEWICVVLGIGVVGVITAWIEEKFWHYVWLFYENFKRKGVYTFKNLKIYDEDNRD